MTGAKRGGVCPEQNGTAASRAYFGPDYQSPSRASLPSATHGGARPPLRRDRRSGTLRVTFEETMAKGNKIPGCTSLVRALALHGVLRSPALDRFLDRQPLGLTP